MLGTFFCAAAHSQEKNAKTAPEPAEIQSVITTLENPVDRPDQALGPGTTKNDRAA